MSEELLLLREVATDEPIQTNGDHQMLDSVATKIINALRCGDDFPWAEAKALAEHGVIPLGDTDTALKVAAALGAVAFACDYAEKREILDDENNDVVRGLDDLKDMVMHELRVVVCGSEAVAQLANTG